MVLMINKDDNINNSKVNDKNNHIDKSNMKNIIENKER